MALASAGKRVCCITPDWSDGTQFPGLTMIHVPCVPGRRLWRMWLDYSREAIKAGSQIRAASFWAEDLWALRAATTLASHSNARVLYDSREIYSALGPLHHRPVKQLLVAMLERRYARHADRIIVSGELDAEYIRQHLHRREKPAVVMNVPPYSDPVFGQRLREHCEISALNPIVVYQGAVLEGRGIELMIRTLSLLPEFHFCILGDGPSMHSLQHLAATSDAADRIHFCGSVPNKELLSWTSSADIGLCFVEPISLSYSLALPNKLFEYAMARIPALVSDLPAMRRVVHDYPFAELIAPDARVSAVAEALKKLYHDKVTYTVHADAAARVFNREAQQPAIEAVYDDLMKA